MRETMKHMKQNKSGSECGRKETKEKQGTVRNNQKGKKK
jgi:hypothetical protein